MYLVGSAHPLKDRVVELVPSLASLGEEFVTSVETFQEIIHRYHCLKDMKHLEVAYQALEEMVTTVVEMTKSDIDQARLLVLRYPALSSRDCIHVAVMERMGCKRVWTYDEGFDLVPRLTRVS